MSIIGIILLSIGTVGILSVYTYSKRHENYVQDEQEKEYICPIYVVN